MNTPSKVLITGASRGIGLALVQQLRRAGAEVIAAGRGSSAALEESGARVLHGYDLAVAADRTRLIAQLKGESLDWLVMNAGLLKIDQWSQLEQHADDVMAQFHINALAPVLLAAGLVHLLRPGGKIGLITSRMGSVADNSSGGYYGYRMSKAALNAGGKSLALDLAPRGISVALLHPGFVRTEMTSYQGHVSPEQSASGLIARMHALTPENSGSFWHMDGTPLPW